MPLFKKLLVLSIALAALSIVHCINAGGALAAEKVPSAQSVTVTSDTMEAVTGENRVIFTGNVVAVEDFTLCSDSLQVLYGKDRDVERIEADGNVRVFTADRSSTSEHLVYDRVERTLVLTGKPQVTQCTNMVKGDRITLYLDKDDALIESDNGGRVRAVIMPDKGCAESGAGKGEGHLEEALCKGSR